MVFTNVEEFKKHAGEIQERQDYVQPFGFGLGLRRSYDGTTLDTRFPVTNIGANFGTYAVLHDVLGLGEFDMSKPQTISVSNEKLDEALSYFKVFEGDGKVHGNIVAMKTLSRARIGNYELFNGQMPGYSRDLVLQIVPNKDSAVENATDGFFRLHSLSQRNVRPHGISLEGNFGKLVNLAWTSAGPILPEMLDEARFMAENVEEYLMVNGIDKFPRMTDYVSPSGVRIANANRVRLGAHLAEGTTVMHEGFCNFNAGTLGKSMVEGRISAGVVVGDGTDIGGGASIMGTLSGGGKEVISLGERCLLGANSGLGISLGDDCIVEAGLYVTSGTKVRMPGGNIVKASELSGESGLLYRRDSQEGFVQALPNKNAVELNPMLHNN